MNAKFAPIAKDEPLKVITVRLPESMHKALKAEARRLSVELNEDVSMNRLCIEKLKEPFER